MPKRDKAALITGIAGGIGQATAKLLSKSGWYVIGIDLPIECDVTEADEYICADLADPSQIYDAMQRVLEHTDQIAALVNNAAIQICKPILEMNISEWDHIMAVNVRSSFILAQACHPLLKSGQGSIVNVSSVHSIATSSNISAYAASKGAITAFTRALAIEFASDKIRVNAVLPGAVNTLMLHDGLTRGHLNGDNLEEMTDALGEKTVIGRIGEPEEIAQAIQFLLDNEQSSFITGHSLVIDGGATIKLSTE